MFGPNALFDENEYVGRTSAMNRTGSNNFRVNSHHHGNSHRAGTGRGGRTSRGAGNSHRAGTGRGGRTSRGAGNSHRAGTGRGGRTSRGAGNSHRAGINRGARASRGTGTSRGAGASRGAGKRQRAGASHGAETTSGAEKTSSATANSNAVGFSSGASVETTLSRSNKLTAEDVSCVFLSPNKNVLLQATPVKKRRHRRQPRLTMPPKNYLKNIKKEDDQKIVKPIKIKIRRRIPASAAHVKDYEKEFGKKPYEPCYEVVNDAEHCTEANFFGKATGLEHKSMIKTSFKEEQDDKVFNQSTELTPCGTAMPNSKLYESSSFEISHFDERDSKDTQHAEYFEDSKDSNHAENAGISRGAGNDHRAGINRGARASRGAGTSRGARASRGAGKRQRAGAGRGGRTSRGAGNSHRAGTGRGGRTSRGAGNSHRAGINRGARASRGAGTSRGAGASRGAGKRQRAGASHGAETTSGAEKTSSATANSSSVGFSSGASVAHDFSCALLSPNKNVPSLPCHRRHPRLAMPHKNYFENIKKEDDQKIVKKIIIRKRTPPSGTNPNEPWYEVVNDAQRCTEANFFGSSFKIPEMKAEHSLKAEYSEGSEYSTPNKRALLSNTLNHSTLCGTNETKPITGYFSQGNATALNAADNDLAAMNQAYTATLEPNLANRSPSSSSTTSSRSTSSVDISNINLDDEKWQNINDFELTKENMYETLLYVNDRTKLLKKYEYENKHGTNRYAELLLSANIKDTLKIVRLMKTLK